MANELTNFSQYARQARELILDLYDELPEKSRLELKEIAKLLPTTNAERFKQLAEMGGEQLRILTGEKHAVAIVGPTNAGKSTLYNQLIQASEMKAEVSPIPGTTKINQVGDVGIFALVDTPGVDAVGTAGLTERAHALAAAQTADFLLIMFDASQGVRRADLELFTSLKLLNKPYLVVLNKMDLVNKTAASVIEKSAENLGISADAIVPIAAHSGKNIEQVLLGIVQAEPELMAALGAAMPPYRRQLAWNATTRAATTAGLIALTPIPLLDFIPLVGVQSALVLGIARIYGEKITLGRAKELIATFGLGYIGRTLFMELSKLGGPPGWALSAAIAAGTTLVMGYAAARWFESGEKLTRRRMREMTSEVTQILVNRFKGLGRRRPKKQDLQDELEAILEESLDLDLE